MITPDRNIEHVNKQGTGQTANRQDRKQGEEKAILTKIVNIALYHFHYQTYVLLQYGIYIIYGKCK